MDLCAALCTQVSPMMSHATMCHLSAGSLNSPLWQPPEMLRGESFYDGKRLDVFSFGIILSEVCVKRALLTLTPFWFTLAQCLHR